MQINWKCFWATSALFSLAGTSSAACVGPITPQWVLSQGYLVSPGGAVFDDEGLTPAPMYFQVNAQSFNPSNGSFTGTLATGNVNQTGSLSGTLYSVTGAFTQIASDTLGITFRYSTGGTPGGPINVVAYQYTGAMKLGLVPSQGTTFCGLFIAGTYSTSTELPSPVPPYIRRVTGGPFPFSSSFTAFFIN